MTTSSLLSSASRMLDFCQEADIVLPCPGHSWLKRTAKSWLSLQPIPPTPNRDQHFTSLIEKQWRSNARFPKDWSSLSSLRRETSSMRVTTVVTALVAFMRSTGWKSMELPTKNLHPRLSTMKFKQDLIYIGPQLFQPTVTATKWQLYCKTALHSHLN